MKCKKVINIFAGPGVGKTTIASELFLNLKIKGIDAELALEYAKELVFDKRMDILKCDQLYIFAKQNRRLLRLMGDAEFVITDAPLPLTMYYFNQETNIYDEDIFKKLVMDTFNKYPNYNILLKRNMNFKYQEVGRYQTEEQAVQMDYEIEKFLKSCSINYIEHLAGTPINMEKIIN